MRWNWEQPDWPDFAWAAERVAVAERRFLVEGGVLLGVVSHLDAENRERVVVEAMGDEAVTTSEIEGETLGRESVQSSIRRALGLGGESRSASPAEQGIAELMVDLFRGFGAPLDEQRLGRWHEMIVRGRSDLRTVGSYRTHPDPMQVVSGRLDRPVVHFEAPPSERVPEEMRRFLEWFNDSNPSGTRPLPAITRAGVAHLYFESIHPFEDGNGRIGRAISEKALAEGLGKPTLTAIAATILRRRREYYQCLAQSNRRNEITGWLAWFAGVVLEAQQRTLAQVAFLVDKTRLLDRLAARSSHGTLNERQTTVLLRVLREGPEGFRGGLSAANYVAIAKTSSATATRDLADLVAKGAMTRTGDRRHARYHPAIPLRPVPRITIDESGEPRTESA